MDVRLQGIAAIVACFLMASCAIEKPTPFVPPEPTDIGLGSLSGLVITVLNVRRYEASNEADWLYFDVKAHYSLSDIVIKGRFNTPDGVIVKESFLWSMEPGQLEPDKRMIPRGKQWDRVEFQAIGRRDEKIACEGCTVFVRTLLPVENEPL